jgi:hypothetical protein
MISYKFNEKKTTDAAYRLLQHAGGRMPYRKLIFLLYIVDRFNIEEIERPITYDSYEYVVSEPRLRTTLEIIRGEVKGEIWNKVIGREGSNVYLKWTISHYNHLCQSELAMIDRLYAIYGDYDTQRLSKLTYIYREFTKSPLVSYFPIHFEKILEALGYTPSQIERVASEIQDDEKIDAIFDGK